MFNFAVSGSLVRYQPISQIDPAIRAVDPAVRSARVGVQSGDAHDNISSGVAGIEEQNKNSGKSALIKSYGLTTQKDELKTRRRLWRVGDLMTKDPQTLRPEDPLKLAWDLIDRTGFRHIPIVNSFHRIEGLLSDRDLLPLSKEHYGAKAISDVMTKRVLTGFLDSPLRQAAAIMTEEGFSSLPVIDQQGKILGILTTSDILKALVKEAPLDLWA